MFDSAELFRKRLADSLAERGAKAKFCRDKGIPRPQLDAWLLGKGGTTLPTLDRAARALGLQPWELIKPTSAQPTSVDPLILEASIILGKLEEPQRREALAWLRGFARGAQAENEALSKRGNTS